MLRSLPTIFVLTMLTAPCLADDYLVSRPVPTMPETVKLAVGGSIATSQGDVRRLALADGESIFVNQNTKVSRLDDNTLVVDAGEIVVETARPLRIRSGSRTIDLVGGKALIGGDRVVAFRGQVQETSLASRPTIKPGQQLVGREVVPAIDSLRSIEWIRPVLAAALVPASEFAGGKLTARTGDRDADITLRRFHIDVHIEDSFARTTIDQTYFNNETSPLEGIFHFPLPADASLSRLAMYVDGVLREGSMVERDFGRNVYETIRYANRDPALLEWVDGTTFKMRIFPLEARTERRILLSYTQRLDAGTGQTTYRFPAGHSLQKVDRWSLEVRVGGGAKAEWRSPSHDLVAAPAGRDLVLSAKRKQAKTDRDVVIHFPESATTSRARFSTAEHSGAKYLMLRYRPEFEASAPPAKRNWAILFESSGDRDPLLARAQIEIIRHFLLQLEPTDTFQVYAAGTRTAVHSPTPQPTSPGNVLAAVQFLEGRHLIGALDLEKAFRTMTHPGGDTTVVHVGTGIAVLGERRHDELIKALPKGQYVGVGVGRRWDRAFMKRAAEATDGFFTQINPDEPLAWRAVELASILNSPRLLNLHVADAKTGRRLVLLNEIAAPGEEIVALTRIDGDAPLPESVTVSGTIAGASSTLNATLPVKDVKTNADVLPRMWAKLEIDRMVAALGKLIDEKEIAEARKRIVALSQEMNVVSPLTSLLVLENADMEKQYKVGRGSEHHWARYEAPAKIDVVVEPLPGHPDPRTQAGKATPKSVAKTVVVRGAEKSEMDALIFHPDPSSNKGKLMPGSGKEVERLMLRNGFVDRGFGSVVGSVVPGGQIGGTTGTFTGGAFRGGDGVLGGGALGSGALGGMGGGLPGGALGGAMSGPLTPAINAGIRNSSFDFNTVVRGELRAIGLQGVAMNGVPMRFQDHPILPAPGGFGRAVTGGIPVDAVFVPGEMPALNYPEPFRLRESATRLLADSDPDLHDLKPHPDSISRAPTLTDLASYATYKRPSLKHGDRDFFDLLAYAPAMNSSSLDLLGVIEAEAGVHHFGRKGTVDPEARALMERARPRGWQTWTRTDGTIAFDGDFRASAQRVLGSGLEERLTSDGASQTTVYPQLGVGARRKLGRWHRLAWCDAVPGLPPRVDDLALGADVRLVDAKTIAVVSNARDKDEVVAEVRYLFDQGRLAERRWLLRGKTVLRRVDEPSGTIRYLSGDGKELPVIAGKLSPAAAPKLTEPGDDVVVLPLPFRSFEHVKKSLKLEDKAVPAYSFDVGIAALASRLAEENKAEAERIVREVFLEKDQRQLGLYVILAALGSQLDSGSFDVAAAHLDHPLAQYLSLHSSPVLRKHAAQWAVQSGSFDRGFLGRLSRAHALLQRWSSESLEKLNREQLAKEEVKALAFLDENAPGPIAWDLLCRMADNKAASPDLHRRLAARFDTFVGDDHLGESARLEKARCLDRAGDHKQAQKTLLESIDRAVKAGELPALDEGCLSILEADDLWRTTLVGVADKLLAKKARAGVLALALRAWRLDDPILAGELADKAAAGVPDDEKNGVQYMMLEYLVETRQTAAARKHLEAMAKEPVFAKNPDFWRAAAQMAFEASDIAGEIEARERALDAAFAGSFEGADISDMSEDCVSLLKAYTSMIKLAPALKATPPPELAVKVRRTADRWRSVAPSSEAACEISAEAFRALGDRDLAWDYLTTPLANEPNDASSWERLAKNQIAAGDRESADAAFAAAFQVEPTNPQLLWDRAENLRRLGRIAAADTLLRQIAAGAWQPRFQGLVHRAKAKN